MSRRKTLLEFLDEVRFTSNPIEPIADKITSLFINPNKIPIGTKVVCKGRYLQITDNTEEFEGEIAYRCNFIGDEIFLAIDFDRIDL